MDNTYKYRRRHKSLKHLEDFLVLGLTIFSEIRLYESKLYEMLLSP